ncbi:hypothetical protein AJ80_09478 [Polytolypa hystricis UAMH7299]|uniref:Uncharacterized protein n=1 Tax=Polytolypa hystricis (strain UAMH7299) TaxID=1447883 RepID=A0A2B7WPK5_POLH7|nr:hypothetical protein AJ80_09478 [Polytolypa hystricis UAMH7299]
MGVICDNMKNMTLDASDSKGKPMVGFLAKVPCAQRNCSATVVVGARAINSCKVVFGDDGPKACKAIVKKYFEECKVRDDGYKYSAIVTTDCLTWLIDYVSPPGESEDSDVPGAAPVLSLA